MAGPEDEPPAAAAAPRGPTPAQRLYGLEEEEPPGPPRLQFDAIIAPEWPPVGPLGAPDVFPCDTAGKDPEDFPEGPPMPALFRRTMRVIIDHNSDSAPPPLPFHPPHQQQPQPVPPS